MEKIQYESIIHQVQTTITEKVKQELELCIYDVPDITLSEIIHT